MDEVENSVMPDRELDDKDAPPFENGNAPHLSLPSAATALSSKSPSQRSGDADPDADPAFGNQFGWDSAQFVFVVAFSHADVSIVVRDNGSGIGTLLRVTIGEASVKVADLEQGTHLMELDLHKGGSKVSAPFPPWSHNHLDFGPSECFWSI